VVEIALPIHVHLVCVDLPQIMSPFHNTANVILTGHKSVANVLPMLNRVGMPMLRITIQMTVMMLDFSKLMTSIGVLARVGLHHAILPPTLIVLILYGHGVVEHGNIGPLVGHAIVVIPHKFYLLNKISVFFFISVDAIVCSHSPLLFRDISMISTFPSISTCIYVQHLVPYIKVSSLEEEPEMS
jgi:hypothetical protein